MNKVRLGFFSFTEVTDPNEHRSYNEWHMLDHMPEQFPLEGLAYGERWVSTPACRAARAVDEPPLAAIHYLTLYLMTEPVERTLDEFLDLGRRLHGLGRFHHHRRAPLSAPFQLLSELAAPRVLISAEAVPYRPHRGIYVVVEERRADASQAAVDGWVQGLHEVGEPALVGVDGVAGLWSFASSARYAGGRWPWPTDERRVTVCWLDGEPVEVAAALRPALDRRWQEAPVRPVFAGPLETITPWQWDWFDEPPTASA